ncbi:hypothetical protein COLO4_11214 [Corchorus olitorius]|uniref:Uncharacterized protein n=1 Tax=Corchorus olitorius TaxID=93759 RepID=A0A1R3K5F0_9ROSI|nr:hypothetical protein COLO4_11214 [Corchorus olitorius]
MVVADFFLSDIIGFAFCFISARSWKVRLTESSGIPRYSSSSSILAFATLVGNSPMMITTYSSIGSDGTDRDGERERERFGEDELN